MLREQNSTDRNNPLQITSDDASPLSITTLSKRKSVKSLKTRSVQRQHLCVIISLILVSATGVWFVLKLINTSKQKYMFNRLHGVSSSNNFRSNTDFGAIRLVGERNSGTSWVFGFLQDCFNHTLYVKDGVTRYKHFFQPPMDPINVNRVYQNTLVIAVFRHPYYWVDGMMRKPHHGEYLLINPVEVIFYSLIMIYDVFHS